MTDKQRTNLLTIPPGAVIFDRLVYETECKAYTGLCRMTRLRMEKAGTFPVPRRLDDAKTAKNAWLLSELVAWARSWARVDHGPNTSNEDTSGYATLTSAEEMVRHMNEMLANM
ncbi:helix-turn-helix transcriptional regulator [Escherichia coli]